MKRQNLETPISVRLPGRLLNRLNKAAKHQGVSVGFIVRRAIAIKLDEWEKNGMTIEKEAA